MSSKLKVFGKGVEFLTLENENLETLSYSAKIKVDPLSSEFHICRENTASLADTIPSA